MNPWTVQFRKPAAFSSEAPGDWFARSADRLLTQTSLVIAGTPHEILEIEFYYRGPDHDDPFAHAHALQQELGRWYFHRVGDSYRGGTFKGLDLTFGSKTARAGVLIRSVRAADGTLISGPSLLVDRLLARTRMESVAALDRAIAGRRVWESDSPLHLVATPRRTRDLLACARVGLSLLKTGPSSTRPKFLTRPYRFLTEPASIPKGKAHMVVALHRQGKQPAEIFSITRCPPRVVRGYVAEYEAGLRGGSFAEFLGKEFGTSELCRLHGIADRIFRSTPALR